MHCRLVARCLAAGFLASGLFPLPASAGRPTFPELRRDMLAAPVTRVSRAVLSPMPGNSASAGPVVTVGHGATPRRGWAGRFVSALMREECFSPLSRCGAFCGPEKDASSPIVFVRFSGHGRPVDVRVLFCERCAQIEYDGVPAGSVWFDSTAADLFSLAREALAGDHDFQRLPSPGAAEGRSEPKKFDVMTHADSPPLAVLCPRPTCPIAAREAQATGVVGLRVLVGEDGRVRQVHVASSVPMLDSAAVAAVRRWRFRPAMDMGRPVAFWVPVSVPLP